MSFTQGHEDAAEGDGPAGVGTRTDPPLVQGAAAIGIGVIALLVSGLLSILLAALADEGRLSPAGIGQAAMLEALSTGLVTGVAGVLLRPVLLPLVAAVCGVLLVLVNLATLQASGTGVLLVRALAGLPEGLLLWIAIGFISRTVTPERWAAILFTGMGVTQLAFAVGLSALVLPRHGANGGYLALAIASALVLPVAIFLPGSLAATHSAAASGAPPLRGWIALAATLCMAASLAAVGVYVAPLAKEAGLSVSVARTAISVGLACQMAGGGLAAFLAGRVRYIAVFWVSAGVFAATWMTYGAQPPAWLFIVMAGVSGLASAVAGPFLLPMTVEADPSRRAAMQSGAVQLLAGAAGPLLASFAVSGADYRRVLVLAAVLQGAGLAVAVILHRQARLRA